MTDYDKENMSAALMLQIREAMLKSKQLPTPRPSRESSRARPWQKPSQFEQPDSSATVNEAQLLERPHQPLETLQTLREDQQPPEVKRKPGRPRKRLLSPSSEYSHVKVRIVPTPPQAEYLRQQVQSQSQASSQVTNPVTITVANSPWQKPQRDADHNGFQLLDTPSAPPRTSIKGMVPGKQLARAPDAQYPPDIASIWPLDLPQAQYSKDVLFSNWPPYEPSKHHTAMFDSLGALIAQQAVRPAQYNPQQAQDEAMTMSQIFENITKYPQDQTSTLFRTKESSTRPDHAAISRETGRKRQPRPSLKVRENAAHSRPAETEGAGRLDPQIQQSDLADNTDVASARSKPIPKNNNIKATKVNYKSKEKARADNPSPLEHYGSLPRENFFITDSVLLHHNDMRRQSRLRSESLNSNAQVISKLPRPITSRSPRYHPTKEKLPWHVTRWHTLGFTTFSTSNIVPDTGEAEYRVILRNGKLDNTLAFWYERAVDGFALKYGSRRGNEKGEVVFNSIPEIVHAVLHAREDYVSKMVAGLTYVGMPGCNPITTKGASTNGRDLVQQTEWKYLLDDVRYKAKMWKEQRRSRWEGAKDVRKEVKARRLSRGELVADENEDCGARSDVTMVDCDERDNVVGREDGLGYRRETCEIGSHWMSREEVQEEVQPSEVLRSRTAQVEMQPGKKTTYKMLYCLIQRPRRSEFEKGLGHMEQRLEGLRICRKSKLQKGFEQIERRSHV